ncbi:MAG: hypothetical protein KGJ02_03180 [Verrucomicrobiota bacterium]|nr:hypothetical protein [Verrucomicrobiota bacterium]
MKQWLLLFFCGFLCAETPMQSEFYAAVTPRLDDFVGETYFYVQVGGAYMVMPMVGVGWRGQKDRAGLDISWSNVLITLNRVNASILVYPRPNLAEEWYIGAGGSLISAPKFQTSATPLVGPGLIIGKSYYNKNGNRRFMQGTLDFLFAPKFHWLTPLPYATLTYGWGF